MDRIILTSLLFLLSHLGFVLGLDEISCSKEDAEKCLTHRSTQYNIIRETYAQNTVDQDAFRALCLSQVRPDSTGKLFEDSTKLCDADDIKPLLDQWARLNAHITNLCMQECPGMSEIALCKNTTDTSGLKIGKFETFCRTFNSSLKCVKEFIQTCTFGIEFYADLLEPQIMGYWRYICTSGCHNIDETVDEIGNCADHLTAMQTKEAICLGHYKFKTCVRSSTVVCAEVMKIVRFKYRKYDIVEQACLTTTSTTTQSTTTESTTTEAPTTTYITTTPEVVTTTTPEDVTTTTAPTTARPTSPDASECFTDVDTDLIDVQGDVNIEHILLLIQVESCIHNTTSGASVVDVGVANLGPGFLGFYRQVKQRGWPLLRDSVAPCKNDQQGPEGCSGHRYGMLQCSGANGMTASSAILLLLAAGALLV